MWNKGSEEVAKSSGWRSLSRTGSCHDKLESWPTCTRVPLRDSPMRSATKPCGQRISPPPGQHPKYRH